MKSGTKFIKEFMTIKNSNETRATFVNGEEIIKI